MIIPANRRERLNGSDLIQKSRIRTTETENFGSVFAPANVDEVLHLICQPPKMAPHNVWMWRGQADISWPIHSSAYRRLARRDKPVKESSISYYEKRLLKRATHRGFRNFQGTELSDFDLLARLQHHGAATRLLDTTRNALVGLFFACSNLPSKTGVLFGIHAYTLGGYEGEPMSDSYDEVVREMAEHEHPQTWQPPDVSPRIAAQHSQFVYSSVCSNPTGSLWIDSKEGRFLAISLSPAMKRKSLRVLSESFDIRSLSLFPDLEGFSTNNSAAVDEFDDARW